MLWSGGSYTSIYPFYLSIYLSILLSILSILLSIYLGLYGALKVQGFSPEDIRNKSILICGAGSAASGVALTIRNAITFNVNKDRWIGRGIYR